MGEKDATAQIDGEHGGIPGQVGAVSGPVLEDQQKYRERSVKGGENPAQRVVDSTNRCQRDSERAEAKHDRSQIQSPVGFVAGRKNCEEEQVRRPKRPEHPEA